MADWANLLEALCGLRGLRCPADHRQLEGRRLRLASHRGGLSRRGIATTRRGTWAGATA